MRLRTCVYDEFNRLTSWSLEGQQQDAWTCDRVGNWTMSGWSTDPKADMLTASPGSKTYTYTPRGSLKEVYANQQQAHTFGYDSEGLVTAKADMQQSLLTQMRWDHAGRRLELAKLGGDTWRFIYDPMASVPAVLVEDLNGTPQAFYVREPGGELFARATGQTRQYYFFDRLGSTIAMVPAVEGNPTDRLFYTPWGELVTSGSRASTIGTTANPYRYVGSLGYYYHHQDAGLQDWMQPGVRFYEPEIGRFERRDPISLDIAASRYAYATDAPTTLLDPSGLRPECCERSDYGNGERRVYGFPPPEGWRKTPASGVGTKWRNPLGQYATCFKNCMAQLTKPQNDFEKTVMGACAGAALACKTIPAPHPAKLTACLAAAACKAAAEAREAAIAHRCTIECGNDPTCY